MRDLVEERGGNVERHPPGHGKRRRGTVGCWAERGGCTAPESPRWSVLRSAGGNRRIPSWWRSNRPYGSLAWRSLSPCRGSGGPAAGPRRSRRRAVKRTGRGTIRACAERDRFGQRDVGEDLEVLGLDLPAPSDRAAKCVGIGRGQPAGILRVREPGAGSSPLSRCGTHEASTQP